MNCKLIADVSVFSDNKVLLLLYSDSNKYDHQTGWFLPDDLVNEFEHPDDAAKRILNEQLGISNEEIKISFIESFRGNDKSWHIVFHYKTALNPEPAISLSKDVEKAEWFNLKNLPDKERVAHHGWALYTLEETMK